MFSFVRILLAMVICLADTGAHATQANPVAPKPVLQKARLHTGILPGGRLAIVLVSPQDSSEPQAWYARPIDASKLSLRSDGIPDITNIVDKANGRRITLRGEHDATGTPPDHRLTDYYAVNFNPRFGEAPIPVRSASDCLVEDPRSIIAPGSKTECYRLILMTSLKGHRADGSSVKQLYQAELAVALRPEPNGSRKVFLAQFVTSHPTNPYSPISVSGPNGGRAPLESFEVTTTADSRLMVLHVHNVPGVKVGFMFNPRPWNPAGWSHPRNLSQLSDFGSRMFCASEDSRQTSCQAGELIRFADRYPLARHPFRLDDGTPLPKDEPILCTYPWIDPGGSKLFCRMLRGSGFAVIGQHTNWTFKLIDGFFNRKRSFNACSLEEQVGASCSGPTFSQTLGTDSGMWRAYPELRDTKGSPIFPVTGRSFSQTIIEAEGAQNLYGEVAFDEFMDGNYLLYWHMNESVQFCDPRKPSFSACSRNDSGAEMTFNYEPTHSRVPDTSGFNNTGTFAGGAGFYQEVFGPVDGSKNPDALLADSGFHGRAAFFPDNSTLTLKTSSQDPAKLNRNFNQLTVAFALKPLVDQRLATNFTDSCYRDIARKQESWAVTLGPDRRISANAWIGKRQFAITLPRSVPLGNRNDPAGWTHVAIVYKWRDGKHSICAYLNPRISPWTCSELNTSASERDKPFDGSPSDLVVGPTIEGNARCVGTKPLSAPAYYALDEFNISRVIRSASELAVAAHVPINYASSGGDASLFDSLPKGLDMSEVRVPSTDGLDAINFRSLLRNRAIRDLGQTLFMDKALSIGSHGRSQGVSCATCHDPNRGFTDRFEVARGTKEGTRNTPTILNRAFSTHQFFDGRSPHLVHQALQPMLNPVEMNADLNQVVGFLSRPSSGYPPKFKEAFGSTDLTPLIRELSQSGSPELSRIWNDVSTKLAIALAVYEFHLLAGDTNADHLSSGDLGTSLPTGLAQSIARGQTLFHGKGRCVACHSGSNYTDERFHNTGTSFFASSSSAASRLSAHGPDLGRYLFSGRLADIGAFKTPTLRHLCLTGPYFHDGRMGSLSQVISFYNFGGALGHSKPIGLDAEMFPLGLSIQESADLLAFLVNLSPSFSHPGCR